VRGDNPIAIECKWSSSDFDARNLQVFRKLYPKGENFIVASDVDRPYSRTFGDTIVRFVDLDGLVDGLNKGAHPGLEESGP
jgi:hypothetical protein